MTTPFELLFGMKPRLPSFPHQDVQRIHYGESFASDRLHELQKARQIANQNMSTKSEQTKQLHLTKNQNLITLKVVTWCFLQNMTFRGKNKKVSCKMGWSC
jgi:hypothetical protein